MTSLKDKNELFWSVKGHMIPDSWSPEAIDEMYDSYFKRMWNNNEYIYHTVGFEKAWKDKLADEKKSLELINLTNKGE